MNADIFAYYNDIKIRMKMVELDVITVSNHVNGKRAVIPHGPGFTKLHIMTVGTKVAYAFRVKKKV